MTVKQLHSKLDREIRAGDGHHEIYIRVYGTDQNDVDVKSIKVKTFVHCSDAVILEVEKKVTLLDNYLKMIKQSFDEYYKQLKKALRL